MIVVFTTYTIRRNDCLLSSTFIALFGLLSMSVSMFLPCAHGPSRAASSMLCERSERADNRLDKYI